MTLRATRWLLSAAISAIALVLLTSTAYAGNEASFKSMSVAGTDFTASVTNPTPITGQDVFYLDAADNQDVEVVFTMDSEPVWVTVLGGEIDSQNRNWYYDAPNNELHVFLHHTGLVETPNPVYKTPFIIGISYSTSPVPSQAKGGYAYHRLLNWQIIPPSPGTIEFGYYLTGPAGTTGLTFEMFLPDALVTHLDSLQSGGFPDGSYAVFVDDSQVTSSVTDVTAAQGYGNGKLVELEFDLNPNVVVNAFGIAKSSEVQKEIVVAGAKKASLKSNKTRVKKNKTVQLEGWLRSGKKGKTVILQRKIKGKKGKKSWKKLKTLTTKEDGYYSATVKAKKDYRYRIKKKRKGKKSLFSKSVRVRLKS